jgi:hypothetical protein
LSQNNTDTRAENSSQSETVSIRNEITDKQKKFENKIETSVYGIEKELEAKLENFNEFKIEFSQYR